MELKPNWQDALDGLYERLEKRTTLNHTDCHMWEGAVVGRKYPAIRFQGQLWAIHRLLMTIEHGPIPADHEVDHRCFNMLCVNPDHLRVVTIENNRSWKDPRKRGHKGGASGEWGIYVVHTGNWMVCLSKEGKKYTAGKSFLHLEEAVVARDALVDELWPDGLRTPLEVELESDAA